MGVLPGEVFRGRVSVSEPGCEFLPHPETPTTMVVPTLMSALVQVLDPRARRGRRYAWTALLVLMVVDPSRRCGPSLATVHRLLH